MKAMERIFLFFLVLASALAGAQSHAQSLREQLFEAIDADNPAEAARLVRAGVHYTAKNADGESPLYFAIEKGRRAIALLLLDNGADVKARTPSGETALHAASLNDDPALAALLGGQ